MILFIVHPKESDVYVVVWAEDREAAKKDADKTLSRYWGMPDDWDVIPLTPEGALVHLALELKT